MTDNTIIRDERLNCVKECDNIIDVDASIVQLKLQLQAAEELMRRKDILKKYTYWQNKKDGKWYCHLPDEKRTLKKRNTEKAIQDVLIEYDQTVEHGSVKTIGDLYHKWIEEKLSYGEIQKGSADRYDTDFKRFFVASGFAEEEISTLTENDLKVFIKTQIFTNKLTTKTYSGLRIILIGILKYAQDYGYTDISATNFFGDLKLGRNSFTKKIVNVEEEIIQEDELDTVIRYFKSLDTTLSLGVVLALQTGLRVGELSALKQSDVTEDTLKVRRTESRRKDENGKNTVYVKDMTKTEAGMRDVFLSDSAIQTVKRIKELNKDGEYLFENSHGVRTRGNTFNKCLTRGLDHLGLPHRSMHKLRKTYCTMLFNAGCDEAVIMNQMGHKSIETSRNIYYKLNRSKDSQRSQIQKAINY